MQKDKLTYLKQASQALKTYNAENDIIDYELIQKIYNYITSIDSLNDDQLKELDDFIAENTISIKHLANIYLDKKKENALNRKLIKMAPIQLTKHQSKIRFIKGKETDLHEAIHQKDMVKVLCKTRNKISKAA